LTVRILICPGGEQRPEHHRGSIGRQQHGLSFDPALELLVQPLDRIGRAQVAPLARRKRAKVNKRFPASPRLSATARCFSRHFRMKALRRAIEAAVAQAVRQTHLSKIEKLRDRRRKSVVTSSQLDEHIEIVTRDASEGPWIRNT
jgi:hypothetical protein